MGITRAEYRSKIGSDRQKLDRIETELDQNHGLMTGPNVFDLVIRSVQSKKALLVGLYVRPDRTRPNWTETEIKKKLGLSWTAGPSVRSIRSVFSVRSVLGYAMLSPALGITKLVSDFWFLCLNI